MLRLLLLSLFTAVPSGFMPGHLRGDSPLTGALSQFRGRNTESAFAWAWGTRAVVLTQFPLSREFHTTDFPASVASWRDTAFLQPENLPTDPQLRRIALDATYLLINQAPDATECVVNVIQGSEVVGRLGFVTQLEHSEVISCSEVTSRAAKFGAAEAIVKQIAGVLKSPLQWNAAGDAPAIRPDGGEVGKSALDQ